MFSLKLSFDLNVVKSVSLYYYYYTPSNDRNTDDLILISRCMHQLDLSLIHI